MTATSKHRLLVVDDEPDLRTLYELTLLREGYDVESAGSVDEAAAGGSGAAVGEEQVPAHLKDAHKHYFGRLRREVGKGASSAPSTAPSTATPASPSTGTTGNNGK